jgi:hypothetical protein
MIIADEQYQSISSWLADKPAGSNHVCSKYVFYIKIHRVAINRSVPRLASMF